ncbi:predicted protein [Coccidioides posadasii str. Silveira]|uniref:Predicted protein n=2 Tax=Coccidioides posadasii TaxID=199306 RepID=E9CTX3_COCPS|nr:predicted protein [Coccidioides posadasii str. Silveira]KMM64243.1 hypothetical protein CPAG_00596 [Coccidioides posadasii RMSCC 3488]
MLLWISSEICGKEGLLNSGISAYIMLGGSKGLLLTGSNIYQTRKFKCMCLEGSGTGLGDYVVLRVAVEGKLGAEGRARSTKVGAKSSTLEMSGWRRESTAWTNACLSPDDTTKGAGEDIDRCFKTCVLCAARSQGSKNTLRHFDVSSSALPAAYALMGGMKGEKPWRRTLEEAK